MDPKNYGYFMGILIIDPNRPGPEKNRPELEPKISKYLLSLNIQDPKRPGSEKNWPERPGLAGAILYYRFVNNVNNSVRIIS